MEEKAKEKMESAKSAMEEKAKEKMESAKSAMEEKAKEKMESAKSAMEEKAKAKMESAKSAMKEKANTKLKGMKSKKFKRVASMMMGGDVGKLERSDFGCEEVQIYAEILLPFAIKLLRASKFETERSINIEGEFLALTIMGLMGSCKMFACYCIDTVFTLLSLYLTQGIILDKSKLRTLSLIPWYFVYIFTINNNAV